MILRTAQPVAAVASLERTGRGAALGTRTIPTAIRRAMAVRDRGCRFPGCHHVIARGHHIDHWCTGGETKLANLVSLCRWHHRLVHEGGGQVEVVAGGEFVFRNAGGEILPHLPRAPRAEVIPVGAEAWTAVAKDERRPLDWDSIAYAIG